LPTGILMEIVLNLLKMKYKEKILKYPDKERHMTYRRGMTIIIVDFFSETMQTVRHLMTILKYCKKMT
jgi:hypothetical protein